MNKLNLLPSTRVHSAVFTVMTCVMMISEKLHIVKSLRYTLMNVNNDVGLIGSTPS